MDAVQTLQARLRADLKIAMRARRQVETGALRALLSAIDDAQAVPVGDQHDAYVVREFGDAAVEVQRLTLDRAALDALLQRERQERLTAAGQMSVLGQAERADRLREEASIIAGYLPIV